MPVREPPAVPFGGRAAGICPYAAASWAADPFARPVTLFAPMAMAPDMVPPVSGSAGTATCNVGLAPVPPTVMELFGLVMALTAPAGPVGPVAPVVPVVPVGPVGPVEPVAPAAPVAPVGPTRDTPDGHAPDAFGP